MKKEIAMTDLAHFVHLTSSARYDYINKEEYRKLGKRILKALADIMGLQKGEFDIRWNPGGEACSGDHTLHTDWVYIALHDNIQCGWFYFRSCKGRKDYSGGANQIYNWTTLTAYGLRGLANTIAAKCPRPDKVAA